MGLTFKPELAALVMAGQKTQTRRLVKPNESLGAAWTDSDVRENGITRRLAVVKYKIIPGRTEIPSRTCIKWQVGRTYAVQPGRGKKGIGFIRITDIRREDVRQISHEDALAEGFESRPHFLQTWCELNGGKLFLWQHEDGYWVLHDHTRPRRRCRVTHHGSEGNVLKKLASYPRSLFDAFALTFEVLA